MIRPRIIPTLLLQDKGLVKTINFKNPTYIGDPINAVKIFNEKEVDEIVLLDIDATIEDREPYYEDLKEIVSEAFMPIGYGGGIRNIQMIESLVRSGIEKVIINSQLFNSPEMVEEAVREFGASTIVGSIDYKKNLWGQLQVWIKGGRQNTKKNITEYATYVQNLGVGEIILNSIDREGTMSGYDLPTIQKIAKLTKIPMIASGGAWDLQHLKEALDHGATSVAGGSMFVYYGRLKGILINYPNQKDLEDALFK